MKKLLAMLLIGCMTATALTGCGSEKTTGPAYDIAEEDANEGDAVKESDTRTTFTVGFDAEFPPYGYMNEEGEYVGFDLSLAEEVCKRNGWELVKQPINWDAKDMELSSGNIDCIWNGFTMNDREDDYTWTDAYVDNTQVFVVAEDSGIKTFDDLAGKTVLVQADSSALHALEEMEDLTATFGSFTQIADYNSAFMDLEMGAADAVAMDIAVAEYQIESRNGGYVILEDSISSEQYGIGFALGNEELRDQVQATLYEMADDGTFASIAEEWGQTDLVCLGK
ncbi:MAG: transporter substrate-binding domain-containing protein [Lachnospiraceae bacterium]